MRPRRVAEEDFHNLPIPMWPAEFADLRAPSSIPAVMDLLHDLVEVAAMNLSLLDGKPPMSLIAGGDWKLAPGSPRSASGSYFRRARAKAMVVAEPVIRESDDTESVRPTSLITDSRRRGGNAIARIASPAALSRPPGRPHPPAILKRPAPVARTNSSLSASSAEGEAQSDDDDELTSSSGNEHSKMAPVPPSMPMASAVRPDAAKRKLSVRK